MIALPGCAELLFASIVCLVLAQLLQFIRSRTAFSVLSLRTRCCIDRHTRLELIFLAVATCGLWLVASQAVMLASCGTALAAYLVYTRVYPRAQFREHGLFTGSVFIPWNCISRFSWDSGPGDFDVLTIRGPWLWPKKIALDRAQRSIAQGFISGAARLEPTTCQRVAAYTFLRSFSCVAATLSICILLCRL